MRQNKYHAKKTTYHGIDFDSKAEARRWQQLKDMLAAGEIKNLERQPEFEILPSYRKGGRTVHRTVYRADFRYQTQDGKTIVEDVKGIETPVFKLKRKLVEYKYPDVTITLVRMR